MTTHHVELRRGSYRDSVRLMQISQSLLAVPGVVAALVAMATDLNLELAATMRFTPPTDATPNDMIVAVEGRDEAAIAGALARLATELDSAAGADPGSAPAAGGVPARTVATAARRLDPTIVLVSTPGRYAFVDAMDALDAGASVMVFSDNVPIELEVVLKETAAARGLLALGPDCGTALLGGAGLGFANVVRPGPVGLVASSGTGAQQVMSLLDAAGVGVSHCVGVGGRDLSATVGGRATMAALDALDADEDTELIAVVGKPPAPRTAERVRAHAARLATPVVFALLGPGLPDLSAGAEQVLDALGRPLRQPWRSWQPAGGHGTPRPGALRGLFSGGSLCDEAMVIAAGTLGPIHSNIPLRPEWAIDGARHEGHYMIDFGDDEMTRGRAHPMIDPTLRLDRLAAEAADPTCGVILLDVVLGHAADPDPAASLAPAIAAATAAGSGARTGTVAGSGAGPAIVVSLIGTREDPQGLERQAAALHAAGASVFLSNAEATRYAVRLVGAARGAAGAGPAVAGPTRTAARHAATETGDRGGAR